MTKAIKKDTIHAGGIDIGIYTTDFKNEYISLTDIAVSYTHLTLPTTPYV